MTTPGRVVALCGVLAVGFWAGPVRAAERPRLGVLIVIDQLSADTFRARLPKATGGLARMVKEGYAFDEARYEAAPTITSVGHATIATGAWGQQHGIAANEWLEAATGQPRRSTEDARYQVLGRAPDARDGTAPTWLELPTLADAVRSGDEAAQAVCIAGKDRAAILLAGRAGLAVWLDGDAPRFTTSSFYAKEAPPWTQAVNARLGKAVLEGAFAWGLPRGGVTGLGPKLPSPDGTPLSERMEWQAAFDSAQVDLALDAVKALGLGRDETPDLLTLSFSAHDRVGHHFGPDAPEALEAFLHLDRELGRLLTGLDALVGRGRYVVVMTSDHGVAPVAELSKARGLDAGRLDVAGLQQRLTEELDATLGKATWFSGYRTPGYTFAPAQRERAKKAFGRLRAVARAWPGVFDVLASWDLPPTPLGALYRAGLAEGRAPDLIVVPRPYWTYGVRSGTGHSSPWLYDRRVPLEIGRAHV